MEVRISELETEISKLSAALNAEKAYRLELEDERNFLLGENTALREQLSRLSTTKCIALQNDAKQLNTLACNDTTTIIATHSGKKVFQINGACGDKNAICCAFMSAPMDGQNNDIIFCGGVDACVSAYDSYSGDLLSKWSMSAPILSIHVHGRKLACGMMDGSHAVVSIMHCCFRRHGLLYGLTYTCACS